MNHLKNIISALGLPMLIVLVCQAEAAADQPVTGVPGDIQGVNASAQLDFLADLFHFDVTSLIWMLIGGIIAALAFYCRSRSVRKEVLSMPKLASPIHSEFSPTLDRGIPEHNPARMEGTGTAQNWMSLDRSTEVTVEEMSSVEEESEVFLMMRRPDMAIKVLRDYLEAEPDCRASVWLKLLDIYHGQGMREPFDALAQEIKTRFNMVKPTWDGSCAKAESRHGLEHFPSLLARITLHWNDPSGLEYLQGLMHDNRHGKRSGFHEEAFREVQMLSEVLEAREVSGAVAHGADTSGSDCGLA